MPVEYLQISSIDCGPATAASVLASFGIPFHFNELRDFCQTGADGTSIESLVEVLAGYGIEAEQSLIPMEHLFVDDSPYLPCILVVHGGGGAHFVLLWSIGRKVIMMDPAQGVLRMSKEDLIARLYWQEVFVATEDWWAFDGDSKFVEPLRLRMKKFLCEDLADRSLAAAHRSNRVGTFALLDGATRMINDFIRTKALKKADCAALWSRITTDDGLVRPEVIPDEYLFARVNSTPGSERPTSVEGIVVVALRKSADTGPRPDPKSESALQGGKQAGDTERRKKGHQVRWDAPAMHGIAHLLQIVGSNVGVWKVLATVFIAAVLGIATLVESVFLYSMIGVHSQLVTLEARWTFLGALVLIFGTVLALSIGRESLVRLVSRYVEFGFRAELLEKFDDLPPRYFETRQVADMAMRVHTIHNLSSAVSALFQIVERGTTVAVLAGAISFVDGHLGVLIACILAVRAATGYFFFGRVSGFELRLASLAGSLSVFYRQALGGRSPIKAHLAEEIVINEHEQRLANWSSSSRVLIATRVAATSADTALFFIGLAGLVFLASDEKRLLLLLVYWFAQMMASVTVLSSIFLDQLTRIKAMLARLYEPIVNVLESDLRNQTDETLLSEFAETIKSGVDFKLENVRIVLQGNQVLRGVDLHIPAKAHVAVVGKSGSGKSTLISTILGTHRISSGRILINGLPVDSRLQQAILNRTSWIDPDVHLWTDTLLRNIYSATSEADSGFSFEELIETAALSGVLETLPRGAGSSIGEEGRLLSGGEGQRVRIARALAGGLRPLVVLDEAFRGLDPDLRVSLLQRVREAGSNSTLICITHDILAALDFDQVIVMDGGRVVEVGSPKELLEQSTSAYAEMLSEHSRVQEETWGSGVWKRVELSNGAVDVGKRRAARSFPKGVSVSR